MAKRPTSALTWWRELEPGVPTPWSGESGDPGIYGPGSMAWHIGRERALLLGGGAALLLQIAHPLVAAGVADHSDFRADPFERLRRTLEAMLEITFGDRAQVEAAAGRVAVVHSHVEGRLRQPDGTLPDGTRYRASDSGLAVWVHSTLIYTSLQAYAWFVEPVSESGRRRYYQETKAQAKLFGIVPSDLPDSYTDFCDYMGDMLEGPILTGRGQAAALAKAIFQPQVPPPLRAVARSMKVASAPFLSERLRREFGLSWAARERAGFRAVSLTLRAAVPVLPPALRFWPHYRMAVIRMSAGRYACRPIAGFEGPQRFGQ